jgi:CBS domain-containing protein
MSERPLIRVRDLIGSELHSIEGLATVAEAMALMKERQVSSLAVNRRGEDDEFGTIAVDDIAREVIVRNRAPERVNVYEIMSKPTLTLPPDMLARYAVQLLVRFDLSHAVVVDRERNPMAMVTLHDLVIGHLVG